MVLLALLALAAPTLARPRQGERAVAAEMKKRAQTAAAQMLGTAAGDVEVTVLEEPRLPGVTIFRARAVSRKGRRGSYVFGVVQRERVELDADRAIELVLRVLRHRPGELPEPALVARTIGFLEGRAEPAHPILTAEELELMNDDWRPHMCLPRRTEVEGVPAIEYWNRAGGPPWHTLVVLRPDGSHKLVTRIIGTFLPD